MNPSKSSVSLRRPLYDRTNTYYSTIDQLQLPIQAPISIAQKHQNNFVCCKEGTFLKCNDYCGNCSECGLFHIKNCQGVYTKSIREQNKEFQMCGPMNEVLALMKQRTELLHPQMNPHSTYLMKRKQLVDWISGVGDSLQINSQTIHHSVLIMDLFTSQSHIFLQELQLIAISCLMISTKFLEMKYPSAQSLNSATKNSYTYDQIIQKEGEILETLKWELLQYPIIDYVNLFLNQGCLFDGETLIGQDHLSPKQTNGSKINRTHAEYLRRYAEFFTDFCIQEECFIYYNHLILACSILAFSRKHVKMQEIWPPEMDFLTGIPYAQFKGLFQQLEKRYYECFPEQADRHYKQQQQPQHLQSQKQQQLSSDKSSSKKSRQFSINKNKQHLQTEIETPDKMNFEFSTIMPKSNDKLSSQKTTATSSSQIKQRNPSQVAQLKLSTNPPDSVKRFAVKKSFITALETVATPNENLFSGQHEMMKSFIRNKSTIGQEQQRYSNLQSKQSLHIHQQQQQQQQQQQSSNKEQIHTTVQQPQLQMSHCKSQLSFNIIPNNKENNIKSIFKQLNKARQGSQGKVSVIGHHTQYQTIDHTKPSEVKPLMPQKQIAKKIVNLKLKDKQFMQINTNQESNTQNPQTLSKLGQGGYSTSRNAAATQFAQFSDFQKTMGQAPKDQIREKSKGSLTRIDLVRQLNLSRERQNLQNMNNHQQQQRGGVYQAMKNAGIIQTLRN